MQPFRAPMPARGFGLIEAMIAVAVVAIGLLGFAKMQALAVGSTHSSGTRALIALQASSLAGAMRANEAYWGAGVAPTSFTVSGSTLSDSTLNGLSTDCAEAASRAAKRNPSLGRAEGGALMIR